MSQYLLRPLNSPSAVTEEALAELNAIPCLRVLHVLSPLAVVRFDRPALELQRLLVQTSWDPAFVRPVTAPDTCGRIQIRPSLEDVLSDFAYECDLPTRAHLNRYLEAYPQFSADLIEFAAGLVLDRLLPDPPDTDALH